MVHDSFDFESFERHALGTVKIWANKDQRRVIRKFLAEAVWASESGACDSICVSMQ
jgi:hypothetical protein